HVAIEPLLVSTMDFENEREYFHTVVAKKLDKLCQLKGRRFFPVDLYRGLTEDQLESDDLVQISLDAVKRCSPYFICLIGEKYGLHVPPPPKVEDKDEDADREAFLSPLMMGGGLGLGLSSRRMSRRGSFTDFRKQHRRKSLASFVGSSPSNTTEQQNEWLKASLKKAAENGYTWLLNDAYTNSSVNDLQTTLAVFLKACKHCFIYVRSAAHQDSLYRHLGEAERERLLKQFKVESDYAAMKVEELKQRLIRKGLPIKFFTTPDELEQVILADFEEHLGVRYIDSVDLPGMSLFDAMERDQRIEQELRLQGLQINSDFSRCIADIDRFVADGEEDDRANASVAHDPLDAFVRRDHSEIMAKTHLQQHSGARQSATSPRIFLLAGERGCGKSTLLSHWLRNYAETQAVARADAASDGGPAGEAAWLRQQPLVIPYYVGANRASCDAMNFMELVKQRVHRNFNVRSHEPPFLMLDPAFTYQEVVGSFEAALSMGKILLVIDGLDCFGDSVGCRCDEVKRLAWLPARLPPGCRIVASTLSSDLTCASLSRRSDVQIYRFGATADTGAEMMANFSADFGQTPGDDFWEAFVESPLAPSCPLAQALLALEYHIVGCTADKRAAFVNAVGDLVSIRQLFLHLLRRWSSEYGWVKLTLMEKSDQTQKSLFEKEESQIKHEWEDWVSESLALIALSRRGLCLQGILSLLGRLGYSSQAQVALFDWHRFFNSAAGTLQLVDGRYKFIHMHFAEIVEHIFFSCVAPAAVETRCKPSRLPTASGLRYKFHSLLGHHFLEEGDHAEAIYHFDRASQFEKLMEILSDPYVFLDVFGSRDSERVLPEAEMLSLWQTVEQSGLDPLSYFAPHVHGKLSCVLSGYESLPPAEDATAAVASAADVASNESNSGSDDGDGLMITMAAASGAVSSKTGSSEQTRTSLKGDQDSDVPMIMVKSATESEAGSSSRSDRPDVTASEMSIIDDLRSVTSDKSTQSIDEAGTETAILFGIRLAKLLTMLKKNEHAVAILKACLTLQQSVMSSSAAGLEQVSQLLIRIGRLYSTMGDEQASWDYYTRAEENLRLAMALCDSERQSESELDAEAEASSKKETPGETEQAASLTERVATNYGRLLVRFGELAFRRGQVEEARRYFERVRFCRRSSGSVTLRAAAAQKFGQLSKTMGNYDQAARLLDKAFKLYHRWYGLNHPLVADALLELGQVLADPAHPKVYNQLRAEACYRCCAVIRERCLGSRHRLVAEPLTSLGSALLQTGDGLTRSETEDVLMRALDLVSQGDNNGDSSDSQFIRNLLRFCRTCWSSGTPTNTRPIGQVLANCRRPKTGVASATALPTPPVSSRIMPRRQQSARVLPSQSLQPLVAKSSANSATDIDGDKPMSALLGGKVARQRVQLGGAINRDIAVGAIAERKYYRGLYVVKTGDPVPGLGRRGTDHSQLPGCRVATPVADLKHVLRVEGAAKRLHLVLTSLPASSSVSTASASGHKAAWWHCPGRYSTTERPYPPRRSQLVQRLQLRQSTD
ncbi:hypothetical protein BOX15_Mlig013431g1, partial [Macrostomum lignano]